MSIKKSILFFIAGAIPTAAERAAAEKLGTQKFRNVRYIDSTAPEVADGYAGLVPENYREAFPKKVIEANEEAAPAPEPVKPAATPSSPAADDSANTPAPKPAAKVAPAKAPAKSGKGK